MVKNLPVMQETWVQSLGWEDPLEKRMATHLATIFLPGETHGQRILANYSPWGHKELDTTKRLLLLLLRPSVMSDPVRPHRRQPTRLPISGILQARTLEWVAISFSNAWKWKVESESEAAQSCQTLNDPMDFSLPGSSIHGIFQARVLEWGAIAFSNKVTNTH